MNGSKSIEKIERQDCSGCYACMNCCPVSAISMVVDEEGFSYPQVDLIACICCGACRHVCPVILPPVSMPVREIWGGFAKDEDKQVRGSSGAFFSILAEQFVEEGGIVCGAAFEKDLSVHHILADRASDLDRLRGTKYIQSEMGDVFFHIKKKLEKDIPVLFCGTPCQTAGLRKYLGKSWNQLLSLDFICHGVPSPMVWQEYLEEKFGENKVEGVNFRDKREGASRQLISFLLEEGNTVLERSSENLYMKGFLNNYYLRPSCYSCKFKGFERCSDITLGDFWSVDEFHPGFSNGKGVSAVLIRTDMGKEWFNKISDQLNIIKTGKKQVLTWNECLTNSVQEPLGRKQFFEQWKTKGIEETIEELLQTASLEESHKLTLRQRLRKIISKL